jgi:hypothetical protein
MIIMDLRAHNFYAFQHFHINFSYPKKIVHSNIPDEHLPERDNFRYKKAVILMGPNASGKTSLGRILMRIISQIHRKDLSALRSMVADPAKESTFSIEFVVDEPVLYRVSARFLPVREDEDPGSGIFVAVRHTAIGKRDSYEACVDRLDQQKAEETTDYTEQLRKIPGFGWSFVLSENSDPSIPIHFESKERLHIFETVMKVLDPAIVSVTSLQQVENSYLINYPNRKVIIQEGKVVNKDLLSSGTYEGISVASMLASIICKDNGFYYCDEKFSKIQSDVEKAVLAVMIDSLGDYDQLFFTTHNTDILTMPYPKHTFMFLKKDMSDEETIRVINASDYLQRASDSLRSAVENDLFSITPNVEAILSLGEEGDGES